DYPETDAEVIERIGDADAVIVSWHTRLDKEIIEACDNLRYIGMACSLFDDESANVAVSFARERGITVKGIKDYGDPGVAEFIISELIQLLNGYKGSQWKEMPVELTGLKIGIIGLGETGKLLAKCLLPFGANLYYYSKTRKPEWEEEQVQYLELADLLQECDVVSLHLPKNTQLLFSKEFEELGSGKILISTSLGLPFDEKAFDKWMQEGRNFAIFDGDAKNGLTQEVLHREGVIALDSSAGWSSQTKKRLSEKVLQNIKDYLNQSGV
ncbi:MAG: dihydrofolate reductase, partial [Gramella sp.]|nr:dihydrofolate reductase [Christiangramia sp.]